MKTLLQRSPDVAVAEPPTVLGMLEDEQAKREAARGARAYIPHDKQRVFHSSPAKIRGLFTGNRFGKTDATVHEALWWATGTHPFRATPPPPVFIRYYVDGRKGEHFEDVVLPKFRKLTDPKDIGGTFASRYEVGNYRIPFLNGSQIKFMSYNLQDAERSTQAYGGAEVDLHIFDEHGSVHIYREARLRLGVKGGRSVDPEFVVAYTPLIGKAAWEYREIYQRWERGESGYDVITGTIWDNPHLSEDEIEEALRDLPDDQRKIREKGLFIQAGGSVYPMFSRDIHVVPYDKQRIAGATKALLIDPHPSYTKGHCVAWFGVGQDQRMFCYRTRRYRLPIPEICKEIRRESQMESDLCEDIRQFVMDGAGAWWSTPSDGGESIAQQYRGNGIPVVPASRDKEGGITAMQNALQPAPTLQSPSGGAGRAMFEIMDTVEEMADEFEAYSWKPQTDAMRTSDRWVTIDEMDDFVTLARYYVQTDPRYVGGHADGAALAARARERAIARRRERGL